jgi:hypothetical protein
MFPQYNNNKKIKYVVQSIIVGGFGFTKMTTNSHKHSRPLRKLFRLG